MNIALAVLGGLIIWALYVFLDIQFYLASPNHAEFCERWFEEFAKFNREKYKDPGLAWRHSALETAFHKQGPEL